MSLEFHCTGCHSRLRVPDDTAGQRAQCPECGVVMDIAKSAPRPDQTPSDETSRRGLADETENPCAQKNDVDSDKSFQSSPTDDADPESAYPAGPSEIVPTIIQFGTVFKTSWALFKHQMGKTIAVVWSVWLITQCGQQLFTSVAEALAATLGNFALLLAFINLLAGLALSLFLGIGRALVLLNVARGKKADFRELLAGGSSFWKMAVAITIVFLFCFLGTMLLIIPGIVLFLMFSQYYYLIIDRNIGPLEALSASREITRGNKWTLFLLGLAMVGLIGLQIFTWGLGLIIVVPFIYVVWPVTYLMMTGQPTGHVLEKGCLLSPPHESFSPGDR